MPFNPLHLIAILPFVAAKPVFRHHVVRQDVTATPTTTSASSSIILPGTAIVPTASPTDVDSTVIDLTSSVTNQPLGLLTEVVAGVNVPISCVECSTNGSVTLSAGSFNFNGNPFDQDSGFSAGNFRLDTPGFGGKLALEVNASTLTQSFTVPFNIPIAGFDLPGVGTIGVFVQFEVDLSIQSATPTTFDFGFDFAVPNGAFLDIDLGDISNSSSSGFQPSEGLVVNEVPFTAMLPGLDFTATAALRTKLLFGLSDFSVLGVDVTANAGAFLDLPKVIVTSQQVTNVDASCNAVSPNTTYNNYAQLNTSAILLTNAIAADIGVQAEVGVDVAHRSFSDPVEATILATTVPLPSACITNGPQNVVAQVVAPTTPAPVARAIMYGLAMKDFH